MTSFLCNSPIYDPVKDRDTVGSHCSKYRPDKIDEDERVFQDEDVYPPASTEPKKGGYGTYHMYHRIDGKLVAVGVLTMTKTIINSDYFMYDPEYSFLHLGVMGAIREIEYIRLINEKYNP
mmetsp:Transcript_29179/g.21129  ORF Transcript_29179/g.21129 Transcript_29179/m.21129 type:complete len:121 (+) Transcript_29179:634-996(+)|eukprot:CAMPEP_0116881954 /NCGR_PEP_ID=MMETSP0463-20121206/14043_1 /TAXON_ID=181622 /ORGANISM="Strombidinopsis sp, Strain SopsisLIS2011" /LENGTH=120 /DNA_ID=CAMNT_0004534369 /DNA_START=793 /DNA_END=1155 /DNA_ORIENTATION=+